MKNQGENDSNIRFRELSTQLLVIQRAQQLKNAHQQQQQMQQMQAQQQQLHQQQLQQHQQQQQQQFKQQSPLQQQQLGQPPQQHPPQAAQNITPLDVGTPAGMQSSPVLTQRSQERGHINGIYLFHNNNNMQVSSNLVLHIRNHLHLSNYICLKIRF